MFPSWVADQVFYHIYPLGLCGAPRRNDFSAQPVPRLEVIYTWLDHLQELGVTALYLGPLFESTAHGYDTADYYHVDRRLGDRATLVRLSAELQRRGLHLVLDGVFNHVGRDFWAFRDVLRNGQQSVYRSWFEGLDFNRHSPWGDPFAYQGWAGNYDLVKLNLANPDVRAHLFGAVKLWIDEFGIDGLRLDAADVLAPDFMDELGRFCRELRPDFWLVGEMVTGDYRHLAAPGRLDAVTNYEIYKSLYSSHVDQNYFELAYALNRQSGPQGIYHGIQLYNFADNHDVNRVASNLTDSRHLYPLYCLLFTMPGIPSIYYGSEWGLSGKRTPYSDVVLRPALDIHAWRSFPQPDLPQTLARLASIRRDSPALRNGEYRELLVSHRQFAFLRDQPGGEQVVVAVNSDFASASIHLRLPFEKGILADRLNPGERFPVRNFRAHLNPLPPAWARILVLE